MRRADRSRMVETSSTVTGNSLRGTEHDRNILLPGMNLDFDTEKVIDRVAAYRGIVRVGTTAIMPSALHDRSHCAPRAFTRSCSCDVGHTRLSDNPIASCILTARHEIFLKRNMNRHHPRIDRAGSASMSSKASMWFADPRMETSMIATTTLTKFSNGRHAPQAAAPSPSCPIAEIWGSGSLTAQTLTDESSPFSTVTGRMSLRWGGARSARGRRIPSPSRPAGHPRVHRADARGWLSLAQP